MIENDRKSRECYEKIEQISAKAACLASSMDGIPERVFDEPSVVRKIGALKASLPVSRPVILYLDDDQDQLRVFSFVFDDKYIVKTASTAKEAMEILRTNNVAIAISDQRMPGMTGLDFLSAVRRTFPRVARALLSAYSDSFPPARVVEAGVARVLAKPWERAEMEQAIDSILGEYLAV